MIITLIFRLLAAFSKRREFSCLAPGVHRFSAPRNCACRVLCFYSSGAVRRVNSGTLAEWQFCPVGLLCVIACLSTKGRRLRALISPLVSLGTGTKFQHLFFKAAMRSRRRSWLCFHRRKDNATRYDSCHRTLMDGAQLCSNTWHIYYPLGLALSMVASVIPAAGNVNYTLGLLYKVSSLRFPKPFLQTVLY